MTVCDNLGEHLVGNIYIKVKKNKFIHVEFSIEYI
jgi:hypothetical protein